jgi:hypothetical protein
MRSTALLLLLMLPIAGYSQLTYDDVEMERIPFKKIIRYIQEQQNEGGVLHFADLKPTCQDSVDVRSFFNYEKRYTVKLPLNLVWKVYRNANPTSAWTTKKSSCAMVYERNSDKLYYQADSCSGTTLGQIMYMDLKLLKGLYHLATAFEITRIEDRERTIEVSYSEAGVNEGKQVIRMEETEDGYTRIIHTSMIRSGHFIRDRFLYPYFHNRLINAFHRQMKRSVLERMEAYNETLTACL